MLPAETRQWQLAKKATDLPILSGPDATFQLVTAALPQQLAEDQVLIKAVYFSNDPALRQLVGEVIDPEHMYTPTLELGQAMKAFAIAQVEESRSAKLPKGTFVQGFFTWSEYAVVPAAQCQPIEPLGEEGLSLTHYLGAFGGPGLAAYYGLTDIGKVGPEDVVVVSGAAGATGCMAVQVAKKVIGCKRVVGIAGSDEKCRWVVESLGADACVNYKRDTFKQDLKRETEGLVDVYFDNVAGEILDFMITRMRRHGRILACGAISNYNRDKPIGVYNWFDIVSFCLEVRGFLYFEADPVEKYVGALVQAWKDGKLEVSDEVETAVATRFEDIPKTWMRLFEGANKGKLISKLV